MDAIYMLAEAAEAKDHDTGRHVRRIQAYSRALALQLKLHGRRSRRDRLFRRFFTMSASCTSPIGFSPSPAR